MENIQALLYGIKTRQIILPEFQREYVWSKELAKQLMVSLFNDYPTGSLLIWKTENPPEIKNDAISDNNRGYSQVLLDGQQRLTTLYLFIENDIPPYYTETDITYDPRDLYFNLETAEFIYFQKQKMENNPLWQSVVDCFADKVDPFMVEDNLDEDVPRSLIRKINNNLTQLKDIAKQSYPIQSVPSTATIDEAIDVFDRINSKGTPVTDAELVLSHITGKWPSARREIKKFQEELEQKHLFSFDLDFFSRCMVVGLTDSALYKSMTYEAYERFTQDDYIETWKKIKKMINYLLPILEQRAYIDGSDDMATNNVFIPIIAYLLENQRFPNEAIKSGFIYWMFLAHIWGRYSGQTDQRLDRDVSYATSYKNPIKHLVSEIEDMRGRLEVKSSDIKQRSSRHPYHRMLYTLTKWKQGTDWINGSSIRNTQGDYYSVQSHHIFPSSFLYQEGDYDSRTDRSLVNEVANRAFITRDSNYSISNEDPREYLQEFDSSVLEKHLVPTNPELWKIENYELFLETRRKLIVEAINEFLLQYRKEWEGLTEEDTDFLHLIEKGESNFVEFKESMRWASRKENVPNDVSEHIIVKTLAGFLNSEGGGMLFIGVNDEGGICGIQDDYNTFSGGDADAFLLHLDNIIESYLGKEFHAFLHPMIQSVNDKEICIVEVSESTRPVFVNDEEFYIRAAASTQKLSGREQNDYIRDLWG